MGVFPMGSVSMAGASETCPCQLGRKALAALGTATSDDLLAAGGEHALAEAVAALTHEAAWLIGTFHGNLRTCYDAALTDANGQLLIFFNGLANAKKRA